MIASRRRSEGKTIFIHITPRIVALHFYQPVLIKLEIPEFGVQLFNGKDLATGRPYRNKLYSVGCRKIGRKSLSGLILDINESVTEFTVINHWKWAQVESDNNPVVHTIHYILEEHELDAASDEMLLWLATGDSLGNWSSRWPERYAGCAPAMYAPRMDMKPGKREGEIKDELISGMIVKRHEVFYLPTIEKERFASESGKAWKVPTLEMALQVHLQQS